MDNNNSFGNSADNSLNNGPISGQAQNDYMQQSFSQQQNDYTQQPFSQQQNDYTQQPFSQQQNNYTQQPFSQQQNDYTQQPFSQPQNDYTQQPFSQQQNDYTQSTASQPIFQQQAQSYAPPQSSAPIAHLEDLEPPVSIGDWLVSYLLLTIPCVNLIMLFVWGFGKNEPKSKSNWAKANLIWMGIVFLLTIVLYAVMIVGIIQASGSAYNAYQQGLLNH